MKETKEREFTITIKEESLERIEAFLEREKDIDVKIDGLGKDFKDFIENHSMFVRDLEAGLSACVAGFFKMKEERGEETTNGKTERGE